MDEKFIYFVFFKTKEKRFLVCHFKNTLETLFCTTEESEFVREEIQVTLKNYCWLFLWILAEESRNRPDYWLKMSNCIVILVCSIHSTHETIDCFNGFFLERSEGARDISYETLKHTSNYFTLQKIIQLHHGVPVSIITLLFNYKKVFFYEVPTLPTLK